MIADKLIRSSKDTLTIEYLTTALSRLLLLVLPSFRNIFCSSDFLFYCYFFALPATPFQPLALLFCYCMRFLFCYKLEPIWNLEINLTHCIFSFNFEQFNKSSQQFLQMIYVIHLLIVDSCKEIWFDNNWSKSMQTWNENCFSSLFLQKWVSQYEFIILGFLRYIFISYLQYS